MNGIMSELAALNAAARAGQPATASAAAAARVPVQAAMPGTPVGHAVADYRATPQHTPCIASPACPMARHMWGRHDSHCM